ncbi:hypothetical protein MOQ_000144 [Trypanosoma cruzi marinkellei]|uniref:RING-type domain-containing protein n=1 Tax=Trypanosoma cruzi marinkellei TaxID=85056 RepID=K2NX52_TRYCR|nr:hypothetical protein MOQ_000144 [Trypanosoma cruzi marinkellei]
MFSAIVNYLILLAFVYLALALIGNIVTLLELWRIRRSIQQKRPPIIIPFLVFTTRPVYEVALTHMANRAVVLHGLPKVNGLTLPLQLHPVPSANVLVKLRSTTTAPHGDFILPEVCTENGTDAKDASSNTIPSSFFVHSSGGGSPHVARHPCGYAMEATALPSAARSQQMMGFFSNGGCRQYRELSLSDMSGGYHKQESNAGVGRLMARSQLSLQFRVETAARIDAPNLSLIQIGNSSIEALGRDSSSAFCGALSRSDTMTFEDPKVISVAAEDSNEGADLPVKLRCACIFGADDVDIMRAVTVGTTRTFGRGSLMYHCYYTAEDEENCARDRARLLDWHNRQRLGARFQFSDNTPCMPLSGAFYEDSVTQTNSPSRRRRHLRLVNSMTSVGEGLTSRKGSLGSFSTLAGRTRSGCCSTKSNAFTETFFDVSETACFPSKGRTREEREEKEKEDFEMSKFSPVSNTNDATREATESNDDCMFVTAVSPSISTLHSSTSPPTWMDSSTSDACNERDSVETGKMMPHTEPQAMNTDDEEEEEEGVENDVVTDVDEAPHQAENAVTFYDPVNIPDTNVDDAPGTSRNESKAVTPQKKGRCRKPRECVDILLTEPQQGPIIPRAYEGSILITPDALQFDANAIVTTTTTPTSAPASLQVDAVDLSLAAFQNCFKNGPASVSGNEVNAGGVGGEGKDAGGEKVVKKREKEAEKKGKDSRRHEKKQNDMEWSPRRSLTFALMLYRQTAQDRRNSGRDKRQLISHTRQQTSDCFVCVYSTADAMESVISKSASAMPGGGMSRKSPPGSLLRLNDPNECREMGETYSLPGTEEPQTSSRRQQLDSNKRENIAALLKAMRSRIGAVVSVALQYVRIGNDLYAVTEVSDRTFVQYREERVLMGRCGINDFSSGGYTNGREDIKTSERSGWPSKYCMRTASYSLASSPQTGVRHQLVRMCWLCMRTEANVITLPCAHFALCLGCAETLTNCCICHRPIHATIVLNENTSQNEVSDTRKQ